MIRFFETGCALPSLFRLCSIPCCLLCSMHALPYSYVHTSSCLLQSRRIVTACKQHRAKRLAIMADATNGSTAQVQATSDNTFCWLADTDHLIYRCQSVYRTRMHLLLLQPRHSWRPPVACSPLHKVGYWQHTQTRCTIVYTLALHNCRYCALAATSGKP